LNELFLHVYLLNTCILNMESSFSLLNIWNMADSFYFNITNMPESSENYFGLVVMKHQ
jgi:hypothetical protein